MTARPAGTSSFLRRAATAPGAARSPLVALPRLVWLPAAVGAAMLLLPLQGLLVRVPWAEVPALATSEAGRAATLVSLRTCLVSTAGCLVLGVPLAFVMGRMQGAASALARLLTTLPLVLPPVVAGLALLATLGRRGLVGAWLEARGVHVGFTPVAVVLAQVFVSLPYLVLTLEGAVRAQGEGVAHAAAGLGASPWRTLWRVRLPLLAPALAGGTALAFARSLGEFGATLTFAGSLQGTTRTLPLEIYLEREGSPELALALAVVLMGLAVLVLGAAAVVARATSGASRRPLSDGGAR